MRKKTFWGGIHPRLPWTFSIGGDVEPVHLEPARVAVPMSQHIGSPSKPTVDVGQKVKIGQRIGQGEGAMRVDVHASVSGTVTAIEEREQANGKPSLCVVIESDGRAERDGGLSPFDYQQAAPEEILRHLSDSGMAGMGGAMFPTQVKLTLREGQSIDSLLINGCECEPLMCSDDVLMQREAEAICTGADIAARILGGPGVTIVVEDNKPLAIQALEKAAGRHARMGLAIRKVRYPQGGEKQLIQAVTGREVPEGGLPGDIGVAVMNVATAAAIFEYFQTGLPLTHRLCCVMGDVAHPMVFRVPLGTAVGDLVEASGGFLGTPSKVIVGGPMMGRAIRRLDVPMVKGSTGLLVVSQAHDRGELETACIRCNRCVEACPVRLMPLFLDDAVRKENWRAAERLHAESCINCGCCSYVCPAFRNLADTIFSAKGKLKERREKKA